MKVKELINNDSFNYKKRLQMTFLLFSLPIIIICIAILFIINGPIKQESIIKNRNYVLQEVEYINNQISNIEITTSGIGNMIKTSFSITPLSLDTNFADIQRVSKELSLITKGNNLVEKCEVWLFGDENFVITPGGTYFASDKSGSDYTITNKREYQWKTDKKNNLIFLQDISSATHTGKAFLVVKLNKENLVSLLNAGFIVSGTSIVGVDNEIIAVSGDESLREVIQPNLEEDKSWTTKVRGEEYAITSETIERLTQKWTFFSAIPVKKVTESLEIIIYILLVLGILMFVVTILLSRFLAERHYQPLRNAMNDIFGNNEWQKKDEFNYLKKHWEANKQELSIFEKNTKKYTKSLVIRQLIHGYYNYLDSNNLHQLLEMNGWSKENKHAQLLLFTLTDTIDEQQNNESCATRLVTLEEIIKRELNNSKFEGITLQMDNGIIIAFICNKEKINSENMIETIQLQANQMLGQFLTVVVSNSLTDISQFSVNYSQLTECFLLQTFTARNQIISGDFKKRLSDISYIYPKHLELRMIENIENKNLQELHGNIFEFIQLLGKSSQLLYPVIQGATHLYDSISFVMSEKDISHDRYISKEDFLALIRHTLSGIKMAQIIYDDFLVRLTDLVSEKNSATINIKVKEILEIIRNNYSDPYLSLESLADELGVESFYLSKEFKKITGKNYIDYVTNIRLNEAKKMIENSDLKIQLIAEKVGYNQSYFNRLFKKKFGVTPGKYRQEFYNKE